MLPYLVPLTMSVPAVDGLVLRGTLTYPGTDMGTRYPLAVLAHQYPATRDSWAPLTADLHAMGIATLAFDERGHGDSIWSPAGVRVIDTPAGPTMQDFGTAFVSSAGTLGFHQIADDVTRVASWGTSQNFIDGGRLFFFGASVGGPGVLLAAPAFGSAVMGIVTVGAAGVPAYGEDAMARIRATCEQFTTPCLLTSAEGDPFDGAANVRAWSARLDHVKVKLVPGEGHAMAIFYEVRDAILDFVTRVK
ncbi:MAG: acetylxylan esterase [Cytophagaceae bacterium]|nr:acetylxylan esterase [Gemmatimonadaceae bacterium]